MSTGSCPAPGNGTTVDWVSAQVAPIVAWFISFVLHPVSIFASSHYTDFLWVVVWLGLLGLVLVVFLPALAIHFFSKVPTFLLLGAPRSGRSAVFLRLASDTWQPSPASAGKASADPAATAAAAPPTSKTLELRRGGKTVGTARLLDSQGPVIVTHAIAQRLQDAEGVVFIIDGTCPMTAAAKGLYRMLTLPSLAARTHPLPLLLAINKVDVLSSHGTNLNLVEVTDALEALIDGLRKDQDPTEPLTPLGRPDQPFHFAHHTKLVCVSTARVSAKLGDITAVPLWLLDVLGGKMRRPSALSVLRRALMDTVMLRAITGPGTPAAAPPAGALGHAPPATQQPVARGPAARGSRLAPLSEIAEEKG